MRDNHHGEGYVCWGVPHGNAVCDVGGKEEPTTVTLIVWQAKKLLRRHVQFYKSEQEVITCTHTTLRVSVTLKVYGR